MISLFVIIISYKRFEYYHGQVVLLEDIMETLLVEYTGNQWTISY
jgi:hypothetical protein